ncbi:retention module-containing protein [Halomonas sp. TBZ9]|uniref:Retention module-containing protein n=1 Tax=Vreelandella azerica TaxID=2732867 RepID=A0A7Y3TXY1_9GAMM|nr:retention module-containing protein [Halomonas azerica]NOG31810.1 retention module-containing protein [Halomonas azerica]
MQIVTIVNIVGRAFSRDENGNLRELSVGDRLQEGDVLITAPMSEVKVDFNDGLSPAVIGGDEKVAINDEIDADNAASDDEFATQDDELEAILAVLEDEEGDILELLEATAAGSGEVGGGGGISFVRLARITESIEGVEYAFDTGRDNELTAPEFSAFLTPAKIVKLIDVVLEAPSKDAYDEDEIADGIKANVSLGGDVKVGDDLVIVDGKDNILFEGPVSQEMLDDGLSVTVTDIDNDDTSVSVTATVSDPEGNSATDRDDGRIDTSPAEQEAPALSVGDAGTINEGDTATFDVSLSNPVDNATTLTFELDGEIDADDVGTPTASIDGTVVTVTDNGNGTFNLDVPAGTTDGIMISVPTIDDDVFEGPEDFTLTATLTGETAAGNALPDGITDSGNATIVDDGSGTPEDPDEEPDDDTPALSVGDAGTINEGDTATFDVSLSNPVDNATTLTFELDGEIDADDVGTPTASIDGTDVTVTDNGNGTFSLDVPAGTTDGIVINVSTIDDDVFEGPEDFTLTATLTGETAAGNALPDGITDSGNATIVDDGSGTPEDPDEEPDDDTPALSVGDAGTINEGDAGTFEVSLSNPVDNATTLTFELDGEIDADDVGTPTASIDGTDVTVTDNGNGTFSLDVPAGTTDGIMISVPTIDDDVFEGPEDFTLTATLTGEIESGTVLPEGITDTGNATIVDDGSGTPDDPEEDPDNDIPVLSVADAGTINEGDAGTFEVSLSNPVDNATTLTFELDGEIDSDDIGTPTASIGGTDVTITDNGNGTFSLDVPAGTTDGIVISVPTIDDDVFEGPEDFTLTATLTGETAAGNALPDGITDSGNATIVDENPIIEVITTTSDLSLITSDAELVDQDSVRLSDIFSYRETNYGEDGVQATASWSYSLELVENATTGLTSDDSPISLVEEGGSGDIVGTAEEDEVFRLSLTEDDDGNAIIKLTQSGAIDHVTEGTSGADVDQLLLESSVINLQGAVTVEYDNGYTTSKSESIDLGERVGFNDDVPTVTASDVELDIPLTTLDSETLAGTSQASGSAAAAFESAVMAEYGADGAGSTVVDNYTLTLDTTADTSAITSRGAPVVFSLDGGVITGTVDDGSTEVLRIEVDVTSGTLTVTQSAPLDHPEPGMDTLSLPAGLVSLRADVTVTDQDGDTASDRLAADLGSVVEVVDDIPEVTLRRVDLEELTLTTLDSETLAGTSQASGSAAAAFESAVTAEYGADGAGSTVVDNYTLTLDTTADTSAITSRGAPVVFSLDGGVITGTVDDGSTEVLRIEVDVTSGTLTVTQSAPLDHPEPGMDTLSLPACRPGESPCGCHGHRPGW